jgi:hypothetical protein
VQPTYARAQPDLQHFYLNGRMLRDRLVASAIRLGYRDVMFHGRHPAFVLFMEIDPSQVDVNAHPAKLEVRFRDGRHVHDFLFRSVERAMRDTFAGAQGGAPPPTDANFVAAAARSTRLLECRMWPAKGTRRSDCASPNRPPPRISQSLAKLLHRVDAQSIRRRRRSGSRSPSCTGSTSCRKRRTD